MAAARVSGTAIVINRAAPAPAMTLELAKALAEAGLPKGVLNVVVGEGRAVGGELAGNPAVVALSFTGSYCRGRSNLPAIGPPLGPRPNGNGGQEPNHCPGERGAGPG